MLKEKLQIQCQSGLPVTKASRVPEHYPKLEITGLAGSIPVVTINEQQEIPLQEWPLISSPYINMDNSILKKISNKSL